MQGMLSLAVVAQLFVCLAASPVIGVATSNGKFRLDGAVVAGNGTVLEGSTIETGQAAGTVQLAGGTRLHLAASTRGRLYRDRMILEKGAGELTAAAAYAVEARNLRIVPEGAGVVGRVRVRPGDPVQVAALRGVVQVRTMAGLTVASLGPGRALEFDSQAGTGEAATLTGCVVKRDGSFFLTDETARITVELRGGGVERHVGRRVEVRGSFLAGATPASGASHVIEPSTLKELSRSCPGPAGPGAASAGAAGAGMSTASKAVIAGVIVAAAGAGTAIAVTGEDQPPAPISR